MLPALEQDNDMRTGVETPVLDLRLRRFAYAKTPVLRDITLSMARGETLALVGPSGVGKSSLLRVLAGLETAFDGDCHVDGKVAIVFQEPTLMPWRNARDNITIPTQATPAEADAALADVGLADLAATYPNRLSLGQQRRLALARAFAVRPDLLLLDEPFVSLDPALVDDMMNLFVQLRDAHNLATVLVTHVEDEARRLADRVVRLAGSPATAISAAS